MRAYSPISISQALRVILLLLAGLGFSRVSHVAQASPGTLIGATINHAFPGQLHNAR